jgi:lysophospholipase L1-like esterase
VITNPAAHTVLCFGDSNTNGISGDDENYVRLPAAVRWTGRLQRLLGDGYYVIEEGLNGRTTDLDYANRPGCNGRTYFGPCLQSHHPLDVVVIMLGTNDLKAEFNRSPRPSRRRWTTTSAMFRQTPRIRPAAGPGPFWSALSISMTASRRSPR